MADQFGPLEIVCDAPPYPIVRACRTLGIHDPEDVGWYRLRLFLRGNYDQRGLLQFETWKSLFGLQQARRQECYCGRPLPALAKCTFTLSSGRQVHYHIGQCDRCRAVFWEEA